MPEILKKSKIVEKLFFLPFQTKHRKPLPHNEKGEKPKPITYRIYGILFVTTLPKLCEISNGGPTGLP